MLRIGLTGGIGCGKTTVAAYFAELAIPIIDADIIARELVEPNQPALQEIINHFGDTCLSSNGQIDRAKLRQLIFANSTAKECLEAILHPKIYQAIHAKIEQLNADNVSDYCIICLPLLFETNTLARSLIDRVLVVDCSVDEQISRVKKRDNITEDTLYTIIASQVSRDFRRHAADDLIDNTQASSPLKLQVQRLHTLYISLSTARI